MQKKQIKKKNKSTLSDLRLWESRKLGATEEFVRKVSAERERAIDKVLGLQPITIRLQKKLVDDLKTLAISHGLGYQPYVRQILTDHVRNNKKGNAR